MNFNENQNFERKEVRLTEETINPATIALATSTFYRTYGEGDLNSDDNVRGRLALDFLGRAIRDNYKVVIVDDDSSPAWKEELVRLENRGAIVEEQIEPGLSASRRQAMKCASLLSGVLVVAESEPEKVDVEAAVKKLALPVINNDAVVVVPNRGETGMENYPSVQKKTEARANYLSNKISRKRGLLPDDFDDIDWLVGVRFIKNDPKVLGKFLKKRIMEGRGNLWKKSRPGDWSDAMYTPLIDVLNETKGKGVASIDITYNHPKEQADTEQGISAYDQKRSLQLHSILTNLIERVRWVENKEEKPTRLLEFEQVKEDEQAIDALFFDESENDWNKFPNGLDELRKKVLNELQLDATEKNQQLSPSVMENELLALGLSPKTVKRILSVLNPKGLYAIGQSDNNKGQNFVGIIRVDLQKKYPKAPYEIIAVNLS